MTICTADFDWISILFLIIAGAISIAKGVKNKKKAQRPVSPQSEYNDQEEIREEYTKPKYKDYFESYSSEIIPQTDYYKEKPLEPVKEAEDRPASQFSEEEKEENIHFDIRQAVISSEILRRPQY